MLPRQPFMSSFIYNDDCMYNRGWDSRKFCCSPVLDDPNYLPVKSDYETEYDDEDGDDIYSCLFLPVDDEEEIFSDWMSESSFTAFSFLSDTSVTS